MDIIYHKRLIWCFFASYVLHLARHLLTFKMIFERRRSRGIIDDGYLCSDDLDGQMAALLWFIFFWIRQAMIHKNEHLQKENRSEKEVGFLEYVVNWWEFDLSKSFCFERTWICQDLVMLGAIYKYVSLVFGKVASCPRSGSRFTQVWLVLKNHTHNAFMGKKQT